jgi:hypothetical protein
MGLLARLYESYGFSLEKAMPFTFPPWLSQHIHNNQIVNKNGLFFRPYFSFLMPKTRSFSLRGNEKA